MSVGPMNGVISSAAGAPLSQTSGSETERAQKDSSARQRQVDSDQKSEKAAGIGQTEEDQGASDRDADGRSFWKTAEEKKQELADEQAPDKTPKQAKDPTGNSGGSLDLTG
jgi:hypothetical protein